MVRAKDSKAKSWVLVKGSGGGGLGDRLRAVVTGLIYAHGTSRGLVVDWRDGRYGPTGENAFTRLFQLDSIMTTEPSALETIDEVTPPAWAKRLHKSMHEVYVEDGDPPWNRKNAIRRYSFDVESRDNSSRILVLWDFDQLEKLRGSLLFNPGRFSLEDLMACTAHNYIRPASPIESRLEELLPPSDVPRIGVHIRATNESNQQKGSVALERYWNLIDHHMTEDTEIFLATDNIEIEQFFKKRYSRVISQPKWFAPPGEALHLSVDCPDRARLAEEAVVDLLGLARTDYLVTQRNSSFGIMARTFFAGDRERLEVLNPVEQHRMAGIWRAWQQRPGFLRSG